PVVDARAFEWREILDVEASIPGTAGDDHRAGADAFTIGETQQESPTAGNRLILQTHDFVRYRHLGPELLRLVVGARHQSHASDAGGKTQIILDPGGGAGLATEGSTIQHEHRETLGRRVDRRGKTRGSGADDGDVIDGGGIDGSEETNAAGELRLTRVAQQLSAWTQHDRQLERIDVEALEQGVGARIGLGVQPLVRM